VDPRELILLRASASDVKIVMVEGEVVLRDGTPTQFDVREVGDELADRLKHESFPEANAELVANLLPYLERWYENWEVPTLTPWIGYNTKS